MPTRCAGLFGLPNAHVQCSLWKHRLRTTGLIAPEAEDTLEVQQKCAVGSAFGSIWQSISFLSVTPTVFKKNPVWSTKLNQGNRGLRYAWRHGQLEAGKTCFVANGCDCWGWILLYWLPIFSESLYKLLFSTLKPDLQTFFFFLRRLLHLSFAGWLVSCFTLPFVHLSPPPSSAHCWTALGAKLVWLFPLSGCGGSGKMLTGFTSRPVAPSCSSSCRCWGVKQVVNV